jgi:hypothetical protein
MALCTQADIEIRLQRDLTGDAPAITGTVAGLIADAQATIEAEVGRTLESAARTESFDGGAVALFLKWWPVTTITSVTEDGTLLVADTDFILKEEDRLIRVTTAGYRRLWKTRKANAIDVVYTGGYLTGTHDAELEHLGSICAEVAARAIRKALDSEALPAGVSGQVQSVSLTGSDTVTYATAGGSGTFQGGLSRFIYLEDGEREQLQRYKRLWLGFA